MLVGGIALLLGFPLPPIRVLPLLNCPLLVLGRSFLPDRPRVVAGWHLLPVTWLTVSCIEASWLRASRFLVSYVCVIVPGIVPGIVGPGIVPWIVPRTSDCAAATIAAAAISGRLIEPATAPTIPRRLPARFLRRNLGRAIRLSCCAGWLHVRSVELTRPGRRGYGRTSVIF